MAPGKKKKKPAANPARGFATVSVPSKIKPDDAEEIVSNDRQSSDVQPFPSNTSSKALQDGSQTRQSSQETKDIANMSPVELEAHLEDAELQSLVTGSASRCKSEAVRQASRLEVERRQLRDYAHRLSPHRWLDDELVEEVISLHTAEIEGVQRTAVTNIQSLNDRLLLNVWTLKQVLDRLHFSAVNDALKHIIKLELTGELQPTESIWGLANALEWYALRIEPAKLPDYEDGLTANSRVEANNTSSPTPSGTPTAGTPVIAPKSMAKKISTQDLLSDGSDSSVDHFEDDDDDDDPSVLVDKYIRMRTSLWESEEGAFPNQKIPKPTKRITHLRDKLKRIEKDILFDKDKAGAIWEVTLAGLQAERGRKIRAESAKQAPKSNNKNGEMESLERQSDLNGTSDQESSLTKSVPAESAKGEQQEDLFGDMFGSTDEQEAKADALNSSSSIRAVDFGKWTGASPRKLLEEICRGIDAKSQVKVFSIHTASYSVRQKLHVSWSIGRELDDHAISALPQEVSIKFEPRVWTLEMNEIAATNAMQAEAYISTLAIFLVSTTESKDVKIGNRLPTIWRDQLKDCMDNQKFHIEKQDKSTLRELRKLIHEAEVELGTKSSSKSATEMAQRPQQKSRNVQDHRFQITQFDRNKASNEWNTRASRPQFQEMHAFRSQLPIYTYKQDILATISHNQTTMVCAQTGSGKSTQLGSFILEQELMGGRDCNILVTQPRRISAISLARRVSEELGEGKNDVGTLNSLVGYAIRLESKTSATTRLTFATTGVLLRMLESSTNLEQLDYLILDEVHERTLDLDLLFIALRQLHQRRPGLKLILMSATLDAKKLSDYFGGAPIIDVPGRTFPVEIGFLEDAVENTLDIKSSTSKARAQYEDQERSDVDSDHGETSAISGLEEYSKKTRTILASMDEYRINYELIAKLAVAIATKAKYHKYSSAILIFVPGIAEIRRLHSTLLDTDEFSRGWIVHQLHSTFSTDVLEKAFERPPRGIRKIVIATNIAETGITIPDVTAVIDTCKEKVMRFDERRQLSKLTEGFISRSSARQRRGRAARVQDGLCFHLVTKHRHDNMMLEQQVPEILRLSLQDAILRIKIWGLGTAEETMAAAIDPPSRKNVIRAIDKLKNAGALTASEVLTPLGNEIARLPLDVTLAKFAIFGAIFKCLDATLAIISYLTSKSPFLTPHNAAQGPDSRNLFARSDSDLLSFLNTYEAWKRARVARSAHDFCRKHHLSDQNLSAIEEQKIQLLVYLVDAGLVDLNSEEKSALTQARWSRQRDNNYHLPNRFNDPNIGDAALSSIITMAFYPRILSREGRGWRNVYTNQQVSLNVKSINREATKPPKWLSFYEAMQTKSGNLNVFETTAVPESALAILLGEAEFKQFSGVIVVDNGRIRLSARHWRQVVALKILRTHLLEALDNCFKRPGQQMSAYDERWFGFWLRITSGHDGKEKRGIFS